MVHPAPVSLSCREFGAGRPIVILHGLLGSGRNWQAIGKQLARDHRVLLVDLRNHGQSPWSDAMDYPAMAADVVALLDAHGLNHATVIGHSMGGKVAMVLALAQPARVDRLAVIDIAPVTYERAGFTPLIEAMRALPPDALARRVDADAALASAVPDAGVRAFLLQNLAAAAGGGRWLANLPVLAAAMTAIVGFPDLAGRFDGPTAFIRGERSDYVPDGLWPQICARFPRATLVTIEGAGHWVHADAPAAVIEAVGDLLQT